MKEPVEEQLWDDLGFKQRFAAAAKRKGMTVAKALLASGKSREYLDKFVQGRSTNAILNFARTLDVPASELFGVEDLAASAAVSGWPDLSECERLRRLTIVARLISAQLAALVSIASNKADADPAALMEFVMREIGRDQMTSDSGNKSNRREAGKP